MSRDWVTIASRPVAPAQVGGEPGRTSSRRTPRSRAVAATALTGALAVVVVVASVDTSPGEGSDASTLPIDDIETSVGTIAWTRVEGDARTLPASIVALEGEVLLGTDDSRGWWRSDDGGRRWDSSAITAFERQVGEETWVVRHGAGQATLMRPSDGGPAVVELGASNNGVGDGYVVRADHVVDVNAGYPIELDGGLYVLARLRVGLPWSDIVNAAPDAPHRVQVAFGDRRITAVSGDFHERPIDILVARSIDGDERFELLDATGATVWTMSADTGVPGVEVDDAIAGVTQVVWLHWSGARFAAVEPPWSSDDRVDIAVIPGGVLARSTSAPTREAALWHTVDGVVWTPVVLPAKPAARTPLPIRQGDDEAIITIFTERGPQAWSTRDGSTFDDLAEVSGVDRRSRGAFGWVAPDGRSAPRIRVSVDGEAWEVVDLRSLLGFEESRWDITLDARALGSTVYVIADRPDGRTLLIGEVQPAR